MVLDVCQGGIADILDKRNGMWSCQTGGKVEAHEKM